MYLFLGLLYLLGFVGTPALVLLYTINCVRDIDWGEPLVPVRPVPPRRPLSLLHGYERRALIAEKTLHLKR